MKISLKSARVNKGLTREEVSKLTGIHSQTIYYWEVGKFTPRDEAVLQKLLDVYGVKRKNVKI